MKACWPAITCSSDENSSSRAAGIQLSVNLTNNFVAISRMSIHQRRFGQLYIGSTRCVVSFIQP